MSKLNLETCTREQFIEVVKAAKKRKEAWETKMKAEMEERAKLREQVRESHYYDIESL
ncbi:MAG: hypothetical protein IJL54_14390 [Prevotella sp.]|nr:hypothetical protein [Prevotella sp.]